ncbi:polymer-forming cytoskeletal protein [Deinococcus sp. PESE-38]
MGARQEGGWNTPEWTQILTPELRTLLHREADGDLSADEQAALDAACLDPQVQEARRSLHRAISLLTGPNPPAPRSVAGAVLADLRLGQQLTAPTLTPELAHQLAAETSSEIASSAALRGVLAPPALPRSLAASVSQDIALARQLGAAPLPSVASVAPAVLSDLRAAALLQTPPSMPRPVATSLAAEIASDARTRNMLQQAPVPPPPRSLAASLAGGIAQEGHAEGVVSAPPSLEVTPPAQVPASRAVSASHSRRAPLLLIGGLLAGLTLLTVTAAWPNLAAGALVMQTVLEHVAPAAGLGLLLLLLTSALVTWMPTPTVRRFGAGAFVLAGVLSLPPLASLVSGQPGLSFGHPVEVHGPVEGNIVAIGGDVVLAPDAAVNGRVVTLLGDIKQEPGAQVSGEMSAVLGRTPARPPRSGRCLRHRGCGWQRRRPSDPCSAGWAPLPGRRFS